MSAPRARWALLATALLLATLPAPLGDATHSTWLPPPPEFADLTPGSGLEFWHHKWEPSLGPPASLLDVLPVGGPAAADFNRDGYSDVFVPGARYTNETLNELREPRSRLYLNDGSGIFGARFIDVTDVAGIDVQGFAYAASWGDYDNDGWPDLFVGGYRMAKLFRNHGDGSFRDVTAQAGLPQDGLVLGGAWGDYDRDGALDLVLVQFAEYTHPDDGLPDLRDLPGRRNVLLHNRGDGTFADASASTGVGLLPRRSTSASFVDVDRDGDLDLYVTNYGQPAEYWRNDGARFSEQAASAGLSDGKAATCQAWDDVDRDGLLDLVVAHEEGAGVGLFLARGNGAFTDASATPGLEASAAGRGWGCATLDYDNDGDVDLFVAHGELQGSMRQRGILLMNQLNEHQGLRFSDETEEAGDHDLALFSAYEHALNTPRAASGAALVDWNYDGAQDLLTGTNDGDRARIFANLGWTAWAAPPNYFKVSLEGSSSNRPGLGALVTVKAGDITVPRQVGAGMSWGGQSLTETTHGFAVGKEGGYSDQGRSVEVTIAWPSGASQSYTGIFQHQRSARFFESGGWKNDTFAPRPQLGLVEGAQGANGWYTSPSVTLRLTAFDPNVRGSPPTGTQSLRYSRDGATWTNVPDPRPGNGALLTFTGEGTHKLWVESVDKAVLDKGGGDVASAPNKGVFLLPVRIDSERPVNGLASPRPGGVYAQGREVAFVEQAAAANRAVVLASAPTDFSLLGPDGAPVEAALSGDGFQAVRSEPVDNTSGVARLNFSLLRVDGREVAASPVYALPPFLWPWPVNQTAAGEYRLLTTLVDRAGNVAEYVNKVEVVPTGPDGVRMTLQQGPSNPSLP